MFQYSSGVDVTRRNFLKQFLAAGTFVLVAPPLSATSPLAHLGATSLRIGVLLPQYQEYPQLGSSFLQGMKLVLSASGPGQDIELLAEESEVRSGFSPQAAAQVLEKRTIDVLITMSNPDITSRLGPLFAEAGVPLLVSHAGANQVNDPQPYLFYNTLGYWQASYRAGAWAAETIGRRAVVVSSFYESGYDALYAFEQGLGEKGGEVLETIVTHVPGREISMAEVAGKIGARRPEFVYAHLSGAPAVDFVAAYSSSRQTRSRPLVGSSFLMEEALQTSLQGAILDLPTVFSWSPQLEREENQAFVGAFRARYGRTPDSFALLGYDTAGLLSAALQEAGGTGEPLVDALRQIQFASPRGTLRMDAETQAITPPLYLRRLAWAEGSYRQQPVHSLASVTEKVARRDGLRSGWLHPYLSI